MATREQWPVDLLCNDCGREFEGLAWFIVIENAKGEITGRNLDKKGTVGNVCPRCGSENIGPKR